MNLDYFIFTSIPSEDILASMTELHNNIFSAAPSLIEEMKTKPHIVSVVAMEESKVVGYKIGYELDNKKFYSWLGGVDNDYRNLGIASTLMRKQHAYLKKAGYWTVQTKTKNAWRSMLLLNIKHGFDVTETYYNAEGIHKIILEKNLYN